MKPLMKFWRRNNIAPFALNRFDKDGSHFLRRDAPLEEVFTNPINTGNTTTGILLMMIRTTVAISIRDMSDPWNERRESLFVYRFAGC
jgi:hypothetical protein